MKMEKRNQMQVGLAILALLGAFGCSSSEPEAVNTAASVQITTNGGVGFVNYEGGTRRLMEAMHVTLADPRRNSTDLLNLKRDIAAIKPRMSTASDVSELNSGA